MAVKIRLKRMGRKNKPFYRIVVADSRAMRDGRNVEILGHYDPVLKKPEKNWKVNVERAAYWLSVGAQPSETVASMLKKEGVWPREKAVAYLEDSKNRPAEKTVVDAPVADAVKPEPKPKAKPETKAKPEPKPEVDAETQPEPKPVAEVKVEEPKAKPEETKVEDAPDADAKVDEPKEEK